MRNVLLVLSNMIMAAAVSAQCPSATVTHWHFANDTVADLTVEFPPDASNYLISFATNYGMNYVANSNRSFSGEVTESTMEISCDLGNMVASIFTPAVPTFYYRAVVNTYCAPFPQDTTATSQHLFYVSPHSLLNEGYECEGSFFQPDTYLADGTGFLVDYEMDMLMDEDLQEVVNMAVMVDLGHTAVGDLSIQLISPSGTEVTLFPYPNGFGSANSLSLEFSDDHLPLDPGITSGYAAPYEPLSTFHGEQANGTWIIKVIDHLAIDDGFHYGVCLNLTAQPCVAGVSGTTFYDLNNNGFPDPDEPPLAYALIENATDGEVITSNMEGAYGRCLEPNDYTFNFLNAPAYHAAVPPTAEFVIGENTVLDDVHFAMQLVPGHDDLSVSVWPLGPDRPGFDNTYRVYYANEGSECIEDATVSVMLAPEHENIAVAEPSASVSEQMVTLSLGNICPYTSGEFDITHGLSADVPLGALLVTEATIAPMEGDETPGNNIHTLSSIVIGAYDPNDKQVSHEVVHPSFTESQQYLEYLIRFQNTGTFFAENVVVADTMDAGLEVGSLQILNTSHSMELSVEGNVIHFIFDDIFLPDSTEDFDASIGYIRYRIKPSGPLPLGTTIENTAHIFFDFNEAIVTNTVSTLVDAASSTTDYAFQAAVYPNPASDRLWATWPEAARVSGLRIFDLSGKMVMQRQVGEGTTEMDLSITSLSRGTYLMVWQSQAPMKPVPWVKF